jgi:type I restriction enzyme M protein
VSRESKVEEELYRVLKNVIEKKKYTIEGVRFVDVEPQKKVDSGRADLAVIIHPSKVLLVIECKKKVGAQVPGALRQFDPMSSIVIDQALNYAVRLGADVFATTNGNVVALFDMPEKGQSFRIDTNRLLIKETTITEDAVLELLTLAARIHAGLKVTKTTLDWAFIVRLRSFIEYLASQLEPPTIEKVKKDTSFRDKFQHFTELVGGGTPEGYAREAAYILMNKIIFYKILERSYSALPRLNPIECSNSEEYAKALRKIFGEPVLVTKDFEPVFSTGIYDEVPLPDDSDLRDEINSFIAEMGRYRLEEIESDVVGFVFENLIKDHERHTLGQFYTPPQIAEFITRWAIQHPTDIMLDPAVGSGTFPVKAYAQLKKLKPLRAEGAVHKEILSQIFAIDINPFPAQLTAVNLAMRDVQHPTSEMNIVVEDFFNVPPRTPVFASFTVKSAGGESQRKIIVPNVDAVVANPPYTRYVEISSATLKSINGAVGQILTKYGLHGGIRGTVTEIGIYIDFIVYATSFLKEGGRLGMIISNGWLQTEYGLAFSKFLLDNFKVKAVVDFSNRLFRVPLIATCVILLEKSSTNKEQRENNNVLFAYVSGKVTVDELLGLVEDESKAPKGVIARRMAQKQLTGDQKWIQVMFNPERIEQAMAASPLVVNMNKLFQPLRGNTQWSQFTFQHALRPNVGPGEFFDLDKGTINQWGLREFAQPAITSIRHAKFFTFTKRDWSNAATRGAKAYFFICHLPKSKLPRGVSDYIKWGETGCRTTIRKSRGGGAVCSETWVCKERGKRKEFCGWYDLGGVIPAPIFAVRHGWYKTRFSVSNFPVAMYDAAIALIPKMKLNSVQINAEAAYLNSNLCQLFIETHGRATSGGVIGLETKVAEKIPVLDVRKLGADRVRHLARLFDRLEDKARRLQGADTLEKVQSLATEIQKIDEYVGKLVGLSQKDIERAQALVQSLIERRTSRVREAKPETIVGEEIPRIKAPPKPRKGSNVDTSSVPLDRWT